jgi:hypothetical protein
MNMVKHEIMTVELSRLVPYEKNPNVHPIEQIKAMADSIERYDQYYPIIVDENFKILCGHGKKLSLEYLGRTEGEVKVIKGLNDKQKLKIVIEDNKIQGMAYIDYAKVESIIKEVGEIDIIGFNTEYLETIINENVVDNMGVDFSVQVERKANEKQVEDIPQERRQTQQEEQISIDKGMHTARTMVCPHCGKEIVL